MGTLAAVPGIGGGGRAKVRKFEPSFPSRQVRRISVGAVVQPQGGRHGHLATGCSEWNAEGRLPERMAGRIGGRP